MLSESECRYLLGKSKPPVSYREQLDFRIRKKADRALRDLTLIAQRHNKKQLEKIFNLLAMQPLIEAILLRDLEPPRKFKAKGLERQRILDRQYWLAEAFRNIASRRINRAEWTGIG